MQDIGPTEGSTATGPWSVKGVSQSTRDAVKNAAKAERLTMGEWLTSAINQRLAAADSDPSAPTRDPTTPLERESDLAQECAIAAAAVGKLAGELGGAGAASPSAIGTPRAAVLLIYR